MGPDYCAKACGGRRCADCPAPTLLPEAIVPVLAYQLVRTQWRIGAAGRTGLDYPACGWAWAANRDRLQLPPDADLLEGVAVIEHAVLQADAERHAADRAHREVKAIGAADPTMGG